MCTSGNCGCNSCNECNECSGQYSSNCKPILDVNCLPTLGRTSRHYLYRTPDSKLWYANANCTAWLELTRDEATETNQLNVLLDLTNRVIEVEQAIKAKKDEKTSDKEDKPAEKDNTVSEAVEALKKELKDKASVTGLEEVNKAVQKLSDALNAKVDKDTVYDDSDVKQRLTTLENKSDNDKQTLTLTGRNLSISNGNEVELPEETDPLFKKIMIQSFTGYTEGATDFNVWAQSTLFNLKLLVDNLSEETETLKQKNEALEARIVALEAHHNQPASDHLE